MISRLMIATAAASMALASTCARADVVTDWNNALLDAVRTTSTNPPRASRAMAMVHVAMFDAVNALEGGDYRQYCVHAPSPSGASTVAAAAGAAYAVLVHLYPAQQAMFDAQLAASLQGIKNPSRAIGLIWGSHCASAVIALRADDGANVPIPYAPPPGPGFWVPTPPAFAPALLPNWPNVACWTMTSGGQFEVAPPPALHSAAYATAFNEVKELGEIDSAVRTPEQTEIALFWADNAGTATPPGHWNVIAQDVAALQGNTLLQNARLFAMLNCALADAAICSWHNKYVHHHWRPITGIQQARLDGNPATTADPSWAPLIPSPPFPAYTSGHSTFSGAGATMLARFFGDAVSFTTTSDGLPGVTRSFTSLWAAAEEAGQSRIYGGIHWQYDNTQGLASGAALAEHLAAHFFGLMGDVNGDSIVGVADLLAVISAWGACGAPPAFCAADFNHDGIVGVADLLVVISHWG